MSQENVQIVKGAVDAYNVGDMDAFDGFYATDVEAFPDASAFPDAHPCHGRKEFRAWLEEASTAWARPSWVVAELLSLDAERVLVRGSWGGEGVASGLATAANITGVFTVQDAQITRVEFFVDHDKALRAAGLAE